VNPNKKKTLQISSFNIIPDQIEATLRPLSNITLNLIEDDKPPEQKHSQF